MLDTVLLVSAGYALCILFPCPGLSRLVLAGWSRLGALARSGMGG